MSRPNFPNFPMMENNDEAHSTTVRSLGALPTRPVAGTDRAARRRMEGLTQEDASSLFSNSAFLFAFVAIFCLVIGLEAGCVKATTDTDTEERSGSISSRYGRL